MMQMVHSRFNALLSACVLSLIATAGWSQSITWLGTLSGGTRSNAYGVSADGSVVVGAANNASGYDRACRGIASWGLQDLGTPSGNQYIYVYARDVSADGAVVVGYTYYSQYRAFRWTESGGMQDLGTLPGGNQSVAYGVSADGSVVVGKASITVYDYYYDTYYTYWRAFRWTASGGMQPLGTLPGGNWSYAYGVSADGAVVVGAASNAAGQMRAFRWTQATGMQDLGTLGGPQSEAYGVSANGAVVVGWSFYNARAQHKRAFRWQNGSMRDLGTLPGGDQSEAYGVSADGAVVVGRAENAAGQWRAVRWTASGIEDLNTTYASLLIDGSELREARAISPDGRYIVGTGYNAVTNRNEAFLLDTQVTRCTTLDGDVNGDGIVDDADLLIVLFNFGNRQR